MNDEIERLRAVNAELMAAVELSRGNVASLGPALALEPYAPYRPWLAELDRVIALARHKHAPDHHETI